MGVVAWDVSDRWSSERLRDHAIANEPTHVSSRGTQERSFLSKVNVRFVVKLDCSVTLSAVCRDWASRNVLHL